LESFVVDYAMHRGHEMLITREPPFSRADMDEIDLHMLQAETIPRLLRVDWLEMDGCFQLRYSLTGKRMLSQRLMAQPLSMDDYYALLLGVIEALDECRHYLLRESCCLLDERYLFVGERWSDVWVAYVPLRDGCLKQPIHEALLGLAARWGARVTNVEGSGLQAVLKLLENPASTLSVLRNSLMAYRSGGLRQAGRSEEPEPSAGMAEGRLSAHSPAAMTVAGRRGIDAAASTNPLVQHAGLDQDEDGKEPEQGMAARVPGKQAANGKPLRETSPPTPSEPAGFLDREWRTEQGVRTDASRAKWLSGALALLVCACCWRFVYMPAPGMGKLLVCLGLSLLLLWGVITLWGKLGPASEPLRSLPLDELDVEKDIGGLAWGQRPLAPADSRRNQGLERDSSEYWQGPPQMAAGERGGDWAIDAVREGGEGQLEPLSSVWETEYLASAAAADETALLGDSSAALPAAEASWLMREHQGHTLRVPLQTGISVIGRSADIAHIVDTAEGVSRTHLEIEWDGGHIKVRDLASRNGSSLNGTAMVPYKLYELKRNDCIQLAGNGGPRYTLDAAGKG